jgi:hypothetical protein
LKQLQIILASVRRNSRHLRRCNACNAISRWHWPIIVFRKRDTRKREFQALETTNKERQELHGDIADIRELHETPKEVGELPGESFQATNQTMLNGRFSKIKGNSTKSRHLQNEN